ncbi:lysylphosphatidylglycerol synthase domain-containing protein [Desulfothermobacter acidiphilus]|uniref:lysylphosphatidylglycerol synthase domain-containing protein n=1 Tax=Desulfothermobacter acidiphilus TaxID=1938353 RepID=UPI003F8C66A3
MSAYAAVFLFINLGLLLPSSPGALGVMQVAFWLALLPFGVSKEQSLALSFAYQAGLYLFTLAVGLPFFLLYRSGQPASAPSTEQNVPVEQ